ncbi:MAG: TolC family protein [Myxococcota bacterium]
MKNTSPALALILTWVSPACAHHERVARPAELEGRPLQGDTAFEGDATLTGLIEGELSVFVGRALAHAPELRAAHARWRASVAAASAAGRLPDPTLSYAGFVRAVETRVGPQRHRISLRQAFPWPGRLGAGREAMSARAAAEAEVFRARVLKLVLEVTESYWRLWTLERMHDIRLEHERLLEGLAETVKARVETGEKSIADLLQVQLRLQRLQDHRSDHKSQLRQGAARLAASMGLEPGLQIRTSPTPPRTGAVLPTRTAMVAELRHHPEVARWAELAAAKQADGRVVRRTGWPDFVVGADYIVTGAARGPDVPDDGKDPLALSIGLSLPVWRGALAREAEAAEARAAAAQAEGHRAWLDALAQLESTLAKLEAARERIRRYERTLLPQAEALESSVRAAYEVQRAGVASVLLALEDALELKLALAEVRGRYAVAWAELDRLQAGPLARREGLR